MRTLSLIALVCAIAIPVGGCGDDDEPEGGGASGSGEEMSSGYSGGAKKDSQRDGGKAQTLKLAADAGGALAFDKSSLTAKAGTVTIVMDNPSDLPHAVEVEGGGVEEVGDTVMKGGVSKVTADLKAGEYEYYCPVGNHKDAGMEGTLTVQ
jgi:plastocyanin